MKRIIPFFVAVACCCLLSASALGSIDIGLNPLPVAGDFVKFDGGAFRQGSGGPFLGTLATTGPGLATSTNKWFTFCVEADGGSETIGLGSTYRVASTSQYVATATQNTVTNAAKYLYYAYGHDLLTSMLGSYVNTAAMNEQVQIAIWSLVVKTNGAADPNDYTDTYTGASETYWLNVGNLSAAASTLRAAAITALTTDANAAANLALAARIRVINPDSTFPPAGEQAQSMLYEVPEATTILVWSVLGLIGVIGGRRQRS